MGWQLGMRPRKRPRRYVEFPEAFLAGPCNMLFVPTLLAFLGLTLSGFVAILVLRRGVGAMSPNSWEMRWLGASFITFTWHELGRSLFLGLIGALGTAPLAIAFFAGSEKFYSNLTFLLGMAWASYALLIFFVSVTTGLVGFLRHEMGDPDRRSFVTLAQLVVVAVATFPLMMVFFSYFVPNMTLIVGVWLNTMGLYAELAS